MQALRNVLNFNVRSRTAKRTMHCSGHLPRQERPHAPPQDNDAPALLGKQSMTTSAAFIPTSFEVHPSRRGAARSDAAAFAY
jgi:hypothetical protein